MINTTASKIRNGNTWEIGSTVRVGFLSLIVEGVRAVKDHMPDIYTLRSMDGSKHYEFIPHHGLNRI